MTQIKGVYNATAPTVRDGQNEDIQLDVNGNLKQTLATALDKNNDAVTSYQKGGTPVNVTASTQILAAPGRILGFYVNSTSGGTVRIADYLSAGSGYLGAAITPAIGWHKFPAELSVGGFVTISGTIDVTFFVLSA